MSDFNAALEELDTQMNNVLAHRIDIGGRTNRAELMQNRLDIQEGISQKTTIRK